MDFLRLQLAVLQERLAGLTPSQKMLSAALVVIMVMTLLYWGRFAGDRDTVALYQQPVSGETLVAVTNALGARGISFDAAGGLIKVPASRYVDAVGAITFSEAVPASGVNALETMFEKLNPLSTQGEFDARMHGVRQQRIEQMIRTWPGIRSASVDINVGEQTGLAPTPAGAVVNILTNASADVRKVSKSAVATVMSLVPGLLHENVTVTIDGTPVVAGGSGTSGLAGGDLLDIKRGFEADAERKIKTLFSFIPRLQVTATASVDAQSRKIHTNSVDPKNTISTPSETISERTESTEPLSGAEPGTIPNIGLDANPQAARGAGSKTERTEERMQNAWGTKQETIDAPAGTPTMVAASVRVPREYFANVWRRTKKNVDPTDEELEGLMTAELAKMTAAVATTINIPADKVTVDAYVDVDPASDPANAPVAVASAAGGLTLLAGGHAKEVAVGALALTSLFMVGRMVKKSAPPEPEPILALDDLPDISSGNARKRAAAARNTLGGGVDSAGEVMEGGQIMMGQELDEEVLETSQMVEQVSGFVKDNPEMTAQLLKRWMNRE